MSRLFLAAALLVAAGCVTTTSSTSQSMKQSMAAGEAGASLDAHTRADFERDRQAILAMAGRHTVTFDFRETFAFAPGYTPKDPYLSGADEIVLVIEDRSDFISLQHILVVGDDEKTPIKHWRQDWRYQPKSVLTFIGGNAWEMRTVAPEVAKGRWSQTVYQVDDSPRYGAVGAWFHENGVSEWVPPRAWRPLPRRDMTTREDYHAVDAVNRHALTPDGWVHEQDNTKLALRGAPQALVREIGVNTYNKTDAVDFTAATEYWAETKSYWAFVRAHWAALENAGVPFALTLKGEPAELYSDLFAHAEAFRAGDMTAAEAGAAAQQTIGTYTTQEIGALAARLR
ncbi:MAG: DUF6607 family protein [Pseudomonadota bacterium]